MGVSTNRDNLHHYDAHLADYKAGDPTWHGGKGKRIIGALNYLAATGVNSISFLPNNAGGDGDDVWPFTSNNDKTRYASCITLRNLVSKWRQKSCVEMCFAFQRPQCGEKNTS